MSEDMQTEIELLQGYLFSNPGRRLINLKMMRTSCECTPDQLCRELLSMLKRRDAGLLTPTGAVHTGKPQVNVREIVAGLAAPTSVGAA